MNATLERMMLPLPTLGGLDDDGRFAAECASVLKYSKLQDELAETKLRQQVLDVLKQIDIPPFTEESVNLYKTWKSRLIVPAWVLGFVFFTLFGTLVGPPVLALLLEDYTFLVLWFLLAIWAMFSEMLLVEHQTVGSWVSAPLHDIKIRIPEFALQTALSVKSALDELQIKHSFAVEILTRDNKDPFLVLKVRNLSFYLEVWNEPDFKARRTE